ncbi:MAG: lycopene beta-cyclase CrtY [Vicinamibacterales bacterium]
MFDAVIVGGGLAGSLAAWRLHHARPDLRLLLLEAGPALGGNHTWSCHATDLPAAALDWLAPAMAARWPAHRVAFPAFTRTLDGAYCSLTSARLHGAVTAALGASVRCGSPVDRVTPTTAFLADGSAVEGRVVIDARGATALDLPLGWQTFLGQEIECARPHGVETPLVMDAAVPQDGAFKFIYVLPFSPTRLLVEDTSYADTPGVDEAAARRAITAYVNRHGWSVAQVVREEAGALPIPLGGSIEAFWSGDQPRIGMRAGLFHPTTGYSLPDAVATADALAAMDLDAPERVYSGVRTLAERRWRERGFFRLLNRWLFRAAAPEARAEVLALFYRHPADLIARFYAGRLTTADKLRLLTGRPPVPVLRALAHLWE